MSHNPPNGHDRTGFYSRYNQPPPVTLTCLDPSRTTQDYADEANINTLMEKYQQTGLLGPKGVPMQPPTFRDVTATAADYHEAMNTVAKAEQLFDAAPARIRDRFNNSPQQLLGFLSDPKNRQEAESLGLIEVRPPKGSQAPQEPPPAPPKTGGKPPEPPKTDT